MSFSPNADKKQTGLDQQKDGHPPDGLKRGNCYCTDKLQEVLGSVPLQIV
jgi:hypothetical protein